MESGNRGLAVRVVVVAFVFVAPASKPGSVLAAQVLQRPSAFIAQAFGGAPPRARILPVTSAMRGPISRIMGRGIGSRVRYWKGGGKTVWILNEIGKYKPITTGFVISSGSIRRIKVLIYRESHGFEVRYPAFTGQFRGARLSGARLSRGISSISGATLSVNALKRLAALALYLDSQVR